MRANLVSRRAELQSSLLLIERFGLMMCIRRCQDGSDEAADLCLDLNLMGRFAWEQPRVWGGALSSRQSGDLRFGVKL